MNLKCVFYNRFGLFVLSMMLHGSNLYAAGIPHSGQSESVGSVGSMIHYGTWAPDLNIDLNYTFGMGSSHSPSSSSSSNAHSLGVSPSQSSIAGRSGISGRLRTGLLFAGRSMFYSFGLMASVGPEAIPYYETGIYGELAHRPTQLWLHLIPAIDRRANFSTNIGAGFSFLGLEAKWSRRLMQEQVMMDSGSMQVLDHTQFAWSLMATIRLAIGQALYE